ncbi:M28 family peptidase [candidate division KSB1 bacterium]
MIYRLSVILLILLLSAGMFQGCGPKVDTAVDSITAEELHTHLQFIASDEMKGRNTPSPELKMAARYIAAQVEGIGLKPLPAIGDFIQTIPLKITSVNASETTISTGGRIFRFGDSFTGSFSESGVIVCTVVSLGYGLHAPELGWDDLGDIDLKNQVVIILDTNLPDDHDIMQRENRRLRSNRANVLRDRGAIGVLRVVDSQMIERYGRFMGGESTQWPDPLADSDIPFSFFDIRVSPSVAAAALGISTAQIQNMINSLQQGNQVASRTSNRNLTLKVSLNVKEDHSQNVVALVEGREPTMRDEYVVIGAHYDHTGVNGQGEVNNGADDDGSGTVALLEIAEAMMIERPNRSVVICWWTGEEKGLRGARHFVNSETLPLDKINAMLQIDMCSRNAPDSIYVIGSHFLSTELDNANTVVANRLNVINPNQWFNDQNFDGRNYHSQSDHYAFHQAGIPAIFYFSGVHPDLHRPTDDVENCDFQKMEGVAKLVYGVAIEAGNRPAMFKIDNSEDVTSRGLHNLQR